MRLLTVALPLLAAREVQTPKTCWHTAVSELSI